MADGTVGVFDESGVGTDKVDTTELTVNAQTVNRQRVVLAGEAASEIANVKDSAPASNAHALVVRPIVTAGMEDDGHSETLGMTTDAAVATDAAGTVSAKLRGLIKILADVWDDVANKLRVDTGLSQPVTDAQLRATPVDVALSTPLDVSFPGDDADLDSDAGTDNHAVVAIGLPASGGHVVGGTAVNPLRTDPTGTTTQPVSDAGGSLTVDGSVSVSNFPAVQPVSDNGGSLTVDGPLTDSELRATPVPVSGPLTDTQLRAAAVPVADGGGSLTVDGTVTVDSLPTLPAGDNNIGNVDVVTLPALPAGTNNIGDVDIASAIPAGDNAIGRVRVTDLGGTNVQAIRPGTAAQASDNAAVVALHPSSPVPAGENHVGGVGGHTVNPSSGFTRLANTTQYAVGNIICNNAVGGSADPLIFQAARVAGGSVAVVRARMYKTSASLTGASFRIHLFSDKMTQNSGDNAALSLTFAGNAQYLGYFDVTLTYAFGSQAVGVSDPSSMYITLPASQTGTSWVGRSIFGYVEARGTYTPASGETFNVTLEVAQD